MYINKLRRMVENKYDRYSKNICLDFLTCIVIVFLFFFNNTATTEIYTLSLHDALPISRLRRQGCGARRRRLRTDGRRRCEVDRKSTRLNSSHQIISYAVFCLKKKKQRL